MACQTITTVTTCKILSEAGRTLGKDYPLNRIGGNSKMDYRNGLSKNGPDLKENSLEPFFGLKPRRFDRDNGRIA
jgi:hypothetical protein